MCIFKMIIDDKEYVAKELVDIGTGRGDLTLEEAAIFLTADLIRLKRMAYFARAFFIRASRAGAETTRMLLFR